MSLIKWEGTRNYVYTNINGMDVNLIKLKFFMLITLHSSISRQS